MKYIENTNEKYIIDENNKDTYLTDYAKKSDFPLTEQTNKGCLKLPNGLKIQWVKGIATTASSYATVTLPEAFSDTNYTVIASQSSNVNYWAIGWVYSANQVRVASKSTDGYHSGSVNILCIGK